MSIASDASKLSPLARLSRALARSTTPLSRPLAGHRWFPLWAVVHHRGRRSGRPYAVPVAVRASPDSFVIPLPWGSQTQWLRNVLASGGCTIRWRGVDHLVTEPRVIGPPDVRHAFNRVQRGLLAAAGISSFLRVRRGASDLR